MNKYVLFLFVMTVDLFSTWVYCSHKKKRAKNIFAVGQDSRQFEDSSQEQSRMIGTAKKLFRRFSKMMDSILRLNLAITAYIPSHSIRKILYRHLYKMDIEKTAVLYYGAEIRAPWNIHIGKGSIIGDKAILDGRSGIYIGENVNFSTGVWIWTLQHDVNDPDFGVEGEGKPVVIHDRAWVSARTILLPGVTIGEGAVVAAGAVVTKSIAAFTIEGGVSAARIGERNKELSYEFTGEHSHFL